MERKFPKNVRQVGNVSDTPKIYVEDYVDTYLDQLRAQAKEEPEGALLLGENAVVEGQECVYITGAVRIESALSIFRAGTWWGGLWQRPADPLCSAAAWYSSMRSWA